jgi:hypothetical protein
MAHRLTRNYQGCVEKLITALAEYVSILDDLRVAQVRYGEITVAEAKADAAECQRYSDMLEELQAFHAASEVYQAMQERLGRIA